METNYKNITLDNVDTEHLCCAIADTVKRQAIDNKELTIYYGLQCPYIPDCIQQVKNYCALNNISFKAMPVDSLKKAKSLPCIFNNWAVFYKGKFETMHLLNEGYLKKLLEIGVK